MTDQRDTTPAPPPEDEALELMTELRAALANAGELMAKLSHKLTQTQLAVLTQEHKTNVHRDRLDGHELRIRALENPEPPAEAATAAE